MPLMVMLRNMTVVGLSGHAIKFEKQKPVYVPPPMVEDCMAKGAIPADEEAAASLEVVDKPVAVAPSGPARENKLFAVFDDLVGSNDINDFTAGGVPKVSVVKKKFGFSIDSAEVKAAWEKYEQRDED